MPLTMTRPRAALIMATAQINACPRLPSIPALSAASPPVSASSVRNAQAISASSRSLVGGSSLCSIDFAMVRSMVLVVGSLARTDAIGDRSLVGRGDPCGRPIAGGRGSQIGRPQGSPLQQAMLEDHQSLQNNGSDRLSQQRLDLGTQRRGDVVALQRVGDIGGEKTDLAAAIEAAAFEFEPVERLLAGEPDHRIGDLDFTPGAAGHVGQKLEDLRLGNVAARDDET